MTDSRFIHAGHVSHSPVVRTDLPGIPQAPLCCAGQPWIVIVDSERIRQARARSGLTQERLARAAGVAASTVIKLERQKTMTRCRVETRARIAAALSIHPQAITAVPEDIPPGRGEMCSQTFPAVPEQVAEARAFLSRVLSGCPLADDALVICSELAANAVQHSASGRPGGKFTVRAVIRPGDSVVIEVQDEGGPWTLRTHADERGRGLVLVDELASWWDIRGDETSRILCARLAWPGRVPEGCF